jgi:hypothetical protein
MFGFFRPKKKEEPKTGEVLLPEVIEDKREKGISGRFTDQEKTEIVKRIAWFWTGKQIIEFCRDEFGKQLDPSLISYYRKAERWKEVRDQFREEYNKAVSEVPLANKRKRLDELQAHYDHHMDKGQYEKAQAVIRDCRDEVEGKGREVSFHFTQVNNNQFNEMTDEQLQQEKAKALELYEKARKMRLLATQGKENTDGLSPE